MDERDSLIASPDDPQRAIRLAICLLVCLGLAAALVVTTFQRISFAIGGVIALGSAAVLSIRYLDSRYNGKLAQALVGVLLLVWFATTPIFSFWFRIPLDRTIISYDRMIFALVLIIVFLGRVRKPGSERHFRVTGFEIAWALLCVVALLSVAAKSSNVGYATRIAVDSFVLPLVAFHLARNHFDTDRYGKALLFAVGAVVLVLFVTGAFEYTSGSNLFQYKGSELIRDGEYRVNGPFASDSSYAIVSLILALFLSVAPRILNIRLDNGARVLLAAVFAAGLGASLMPLFRVVAAALAISWFVLEVGASDSRHGARSKKNAELDEAFRNGNSRFSRTGRALWMTATRVIIAAALIILVLVKWDAISGAASAEQRLLSPNSMYGRLATWEAALTIAANHPFIGVGLCNYTDSFNTEYEEKSRLLKPDLELVVSDSPHSNILWVAAELGVAGVIPYLAANLFLLWMGCRALKRAKNTQSRVSAAMFVALLMAYSIPGIALTSGAYSDLNLYSFFLLGLLSRRMQHQRSEEKPRVHQDARAELHEPGVAQPILGLR